MTASFTNGTAMNDKLKLLTENNKEVWILLKSKYKLFHLSNVFFRDLHYGVMSYLQLKGMKSPYGEAEQLTRAWIEALEQSGLLKRIDGEAYMLNNPEFRKPAVKPAAAAKPAAPKPAPAAAGQAAGVAKPVTPAATPRTESATTGASTAGQNS